MKPGLVVAGTDKSVSPYIELPLSSVAYLLGIPEHALDRKDRIMLAAADAYALAEQLCAAAFEAQGGASEPGWTRFQQQQEREPRRSWFEQLYARVRYIADDFHRETIRRRDGKEPGRFDVAFCDPNQAIVETGKLVHDRVSDWDY